MITSSRSPDVIVVVMDCVRADAFEPFHRDGSPAMPFAAKLMGESLVVSRAVSPASWTLPATASILSGKYPWEHGIWGRSGKSYRSGVSGLARKLSDSGYHTFALTANPILSPDFGPMSEFDMVSWGSLSAQYLRTPGLVRPPKSWSRGQLTDNSPPSPLVPTLAKFIQRNVGVVDGPVRVLRRIMDHERERNSSPSPWIGPSIEHLMKQIPDDRPSFTFVNLMEAHEPYVGLPLDQTSHGSWLDFVRHRQDRSGWLSGSWTPSTDDYEFLESLYRASILDIDRTLEGVVTVLKDCGRWDNSVFILTSDHGQTFEPGKPIYHGIGAPDSLLRIPLWIRAPETISSGVFDSAWVSSVDLLPTIMTALGMPLGDTSGTPIQSTIRAESRSPVFALGDGLVWDAGEDLNPARTRELDEWSLVGYAEGCRVSLDLRTSVEKVEEAPLPRATRVSGSFEVVVEPGPTILRLREIRNELLPELGNKERTTGVDQRLAGWGYV